MEGCHLFGGVLVERERERDGMNIIKKIRSTLVIVRKLRGAGQPVALSLTSSLVEFY